MKRRGTPRAPRQARLREDHNAQTRARILDAVARILARGVADLSVQAVARESGISRPTLYRHFPTKRAMVEAIGKRYAESLGLDGAHFPRDLDELLAALPTVYARSEALDDTLRAAVWSQLVRRTTGQEGKAYRLTRMEAILAPFVTELSSGDRLRLLRVATMLCSSAARKAFHDVVGSSSAEAADCVTWTLRRLTGGRS
jgi:AcrR family transcriptional regulator